MDRTYMELAARALGMPGAERRDPLRVERELMDRWGLTPEAWAEIADALVMLTQPFDDPMLGRNVRAFGYSDENHGGRWRVILAHLPLEDKPAPPEGQEENACG